MCMNVCVCDGHPPGTPQHSSQMGVQKVTTVLLVCLTNTRNSDIAVTVVQKNEAMLEKIVSELCVSQ